MVCIPGAGAHRSPSMGLFVPGPIVSQAPARTHGGQNRPCSRSHSQTEGKNCFPQSLLPKGTVGCGWRKQGESKRKALKHFWGQTQALLSSAGHTASSSAPLLQMGKLRQGERTGPHFPR